MSTQHAFTTSCLIALAASAGAQNDPKPAPNLPPFLPDVKTPAVFDRVTPGSTRAESAPRETKRTAKVPSDAAATPVSVIDFTRVHFDEPGDGNTWVRGRTYKASFDGESATYIPFLGSRAPHNFPVRVHLVEATAGGSPITIEPGGISRDGNSITIDHGAIREVWHMGLDSAEQTFEIEARPAVKGPLALRIAIDTELTIRHDGDGFALDGSHGGVRIGRATAIDADGRRLDLAMRLEGVELAIDVPADFAEGARYPLVVDPVYSSYALENQANACLIGDISNSGAAFYWGAVYDFEYSATDRDIYTVDVYDGIPLAGSGGWVDSTSVFWAAPTIAYNALHDTYLTVAVVSPPGAVPPSIWCRARQAGTAVQYAQRQVSVSLGEGCVDARVGGDPALAGPTYFLVAWARRYSHLDSDIHARLVEWNGTPSASGTIFLENSGAFDDRPSVSRTNGLPPYATQEWNVVWQRYTASGTGDIPGAQIHWDGSITTPPFTIDASSDLDLYPCASSPLDGASGPRPWLVTFHRDYGDDDIYAKLYAGSTLLSQVNVSVLEGADLYQDQIFAHVDSNGKRFVIIYGESYQFDQQDYDQYIASIRYADGYLQLDEGHALVDSSPRSSYGGRVACGNSIANPGFDFYGIVWPHFSGGPPTDWFVGTYRELPTTEGICSGDGSAGTCPCGNTGAPYRGCANSATNGAGIAVGGSFTTGDDTGLIRGIEMPTTTTALLFQGSSSSTNGTVFGDGLRCVGGTVIRIGTKVASGGIVDYPEAGDVPISVKGLVPQDGGWRTYQYWYRNGADFCTPATFNMSSAIRVLWLR